MSEILKIVTRDRRGGNSGKERHELLYPILEDRCHQEHNPIFHLMNEYTECIDSDKVCRADFSKVLKPIREAKDIPESALISSHCHALSHLITNQTIKHNYFYSALELPSSVRVSFRE